MNSRHSDRLVCSLGTVERRRLIALLGATVAGLIGTGDVDADKIRKRRRKQRHDKRRTKRRRRRERINRNWRRNTKVCSVNDQSTRCSSSMSCCNPERSNWGSCVMSAETTTCCGAGDGRTWYYFANDYRCCPSPWEGNHGACPDSLPVCCPGQCCLLGATCGEEGKCWTPGA
jgi:hypothetical protein